MEDEILIKTSEEHKYFTMDELIASKTAKKLKIDNTPKDDFTISNLHWIMTRLDDIREAWGKPIIITSGYRCEELNKAVGGVTTSYHQLGLAVDIKWNQKLFNFIRDNFKFDKLIEERSGSGKWIHLQFRHYNERQQVLTLQA